MPYWEFVSQVDAAVDERPEFANGEDLENAGRLPDGVVQPLVEPDLWNAV